MNTAILNHENSRLPLNSSDNQKYPLQRQRDPLHQNRRQIRSSRTFSGPGQDNEPVHKEYSRRLSHASQADEADPADRFYETERHWYASFMTDCALQIRTAIPGGMPDLMIAYTDADYVEHRLFLSENSDNGHVTLVDDTIEAVG